MFFGKLPIFNIGSKMKRVRSYEEKLILKPCPFCKKEVFVRDCGYSTFNPGQSKCEHCKREWHLGFVEDSWEAGLRWNKLQKHLKKIDKIFQYLEKVEAETGVSCFHLKK